MRIILDKLITYVGRWNDRAAITSLDKNFDKINEELAKHHEISRNFIDADVQPDFQLPSGHHTEKDYYVVKTDAGATAVNLIPYTGETIEGASSLALAAQNDHALLTFNRGVWYLISS